MSLKRERKMDRSEIEGKANWEDPAEAMDGRGRRERAIRRPGEEALLEG